MAGLKIVPTFLAAHKTDYSFFINAANELTSEQLWDRQLGNNSIANLLCHIAEMERFWIDSGLFGEHIEREREIEFSRTADLTPKQLVSRLTERCDLTQTKVADVTLENLERPRPFHGDEMTGAGILMWHTRHLGLHQGQIIMLKRLVAGLCKIRIIPVVIADMFININIL